MLAWRAAGWWDSGYSSRLEQEHFVFAMPWSATRSRGRFHEWRQYGSTEPLRGSIATAMHSRMHEESRCSSGDSTSECEIVLDAATALDWVTDYDRSRALVLEAEKLAKEGASPALRARLTLGKGRASYRAEQWQEARTALEEAARLAEQVGDDAYETFIISLVMLEMVLGELRCVDEAERVSERAI